MPSDGSRPGLLGWFRRLEETSVGRRTNLRAKLAEATRYFAKHVIWRASTVHRPDSAPDIVLLTSRRSGGTMLMESLARARGVKFINQPLKGTHYDPFLRITRPNDIPVHGVDEHAMRELFDAIFSGGINVEQEWNLFRPTYHWKTNRVLCKVHNCKHWIEWFRSTYPVRILYLVRHPVPAALSTMRWGWAILDGLYLRDPVVRALLTPEQSRFLDESGDRSLLERYVTTWILENLVPIRAVQNGSLAEVVTYEALLQRPEVTLRYAAKACEIPYTERLSEGLVRPSRTTSDESRLLLRGADREQARVIQLGGWMERTNAGDLHAVQALLDLFDIDLYSVDSPEPNAKYEGAKGALATRGPVASAGTGKGPGE